MIWLIQVIFEYFYCDSSRDVASLHGMKNLSRSKQVTKDSRTDYWARTFFLDKVLDAYLIAGAMKMFSLSSTEDQTATFNTEQGEAYNNVITAQAHGFQLIFVLDALIDGHLSLQVLYQSTTDSYILQLFVEWAVENAAVSQ